MGLVAGHALPDGASAPTNLARLYCSIMLRYSMKVSSCFHVGWRGIQH